MKRIYAMSRWTVAMIFLYHGLVPKILFKSHQEVMMNDVLIPFMSEQAALYLSGVAEVVYGILLLVFYTSRRLLYPAIAFSVLVTITLLIVLPALFQHAFNPFSINLSVFILCLVNLASHPGQRRAIETGK